MHYVYRSTTDKLPEAIEHVTESGDSIVGDPVHIGGRDWVLLCRKGGPSDEAEMAKALGRLRASIDRLADQITRLERRLTQHPGPKAVQ